MAQPAGKPPTFDELYRRIQALPEGKTGEILEPGVLRTMSRPGKRHRRAQRHCLAALGSIDRTLAGSGWWIELEAEIGVLGDRLAVPDLSGWRVERVPELPDENPITILPDWCCEVLSPTTARDDKRVKLPLYARSGVDWIWLVDAEARLVEIYQRVGELPALRTTAAEEEKAMLPPFEIVVDLAPWWLPAT
jgi:Uma2 family endonuclease